MRERTAQRFLEHAEFETYLPMISGKNRAGPLFPAYLFVRVGDTGWSRIDNTIGVLQLLRAGDKPARIADQIIGEIRGRERNGLVRLPERPRWQRGDRVRIGKGMFLGQIALFDGMTARERVFVLLNLFGRQTRAQVPVGDLQNVDLQ
jgi:transcription antitermination factor NusG